MKIVPYLNFDGQCEEAFRFYEQCLGGKIMGIMKTEESPMAGEMGPEWNGRVIHACMEVGDQLLMASDSPPGQHQAPQGTYVSLHIDDPAEGERVFNALAEGGSVQMAFEKTFWAERFGMATDRFGTPWMVNCAGEKGQDCQAQA
jgi:PhnB protein